MGAAAGSVTPERAQRKRLQKLGVMGGMSLLALVAVATQFRGEPAFTGVPVPAATPIPAQTSTSSLLPSSTGVPAEAVGWQGSELVMGFDSVPLPQAIAWLAHATHATVAGVHLLHKPVAVTLHLRSSDAGVAWRRLLQDHAQFSVDCSAPGCQVRITGEIGAVSAGTERSLPDGSGAPESAVDTELEQSQPDGSC